MPVRSAVCLALALSATACFAADLPAPLDAAPAGNIVVPSPLPAAPPAGVLSSPSRIYEQLAPAPLVSPAPQVAPALAKPLVAPPAAAPVIVTPPVSSYSYSDSPPPRLPIWTDPPRLPSTVPAGALHTRYPYYSYRRPWYTPGPASLNSTIVW